MFKAHRLVCHSTLGWRVIIKKKKVETLSKCPLIKCLRTDKFHMSTAACEDSNIIWRGLGPRSISWSQFMIPGTNDKDRAERESKRKW